MSTVHILGAVLVGAVVLTWALLAIAGHIGTRRQKHRDRRVAAIITATLRHPAGSDPLHVADQFWHDYGTPIYDQLAYEYAQSDEVADQQVAMVEMRLASIGMADVPDARLWAWMDGDAS